MLTLTEIATASLVIIGTATKKYWLEKVGQAAGHLLEGAGFLVIQPLNQRLASKLALRRYCRRRLKSENQFLFVPARDELKVDIDSVYVTLSLEHKGAEQHTFTHADLLSAGNRIRIIGDPGSGKSSIIKRLFRDECKQAIRGSAARLPVLIELRNLELPAEMNPDALRHWLYEHIKETVSNVCAYNIKGCFQAYAETRGLLVLLDGLDEVATHDFERFLAAIHGLSEKLAGLSEENVIIITMRIQFHQQVKHFFQNSLGLVLSVRPFTNTDIYEFLNRWNFGAKRTQTITRIYGQLCDQPTLRELCSNPLILAMYVAQDQFGDNLIPPDSRTYFYKTVTDELLIRRRIRQIGQSAGGSKLRELREGILGGIALAHLLDLAQSANSIDWKMAVNTVAAQSACSIEQAETLLRDTSTATGLITEEREGQTLRFIHLTFCEFLAASHAIKWSQDGFPRLLQAHRNVLAQPGAQFNTRLIEVIPFAVGLLHPGLRANALFFISEFGNAGLSARCFLETRAYELELWRQFLETQKQALLQLSRNGGDFGRQFFLDLHVFGVVIQDAMLSAKNGARISASLDLNLFYSELLAGRSGGLSAILHSYAKHDAMAAFRMATFCEMDLLEDLPELVADNCEQPAFLALVSSRILETADDIDKLYRWANIIATAGIRSTLAAAALARHPPEPALEQMILRSRAKPFQVWSLPEKTFYGQVLTLAYDNKKPGVVAGQLLDSFRNCVHPISYKNSIAGCLFLHILIIPLSVGMFALTVMNKSFWPIFGFILCVFCSLIAIWSMTAPQGAYACLLNLPQPKHHAKIPFRWLIKNDGGGLLGWKVGLRVLSKKSYRSMCDIIVMRGGHRSV